MKRNSIQPALGSVPPKVDEARAALHGWLYDLAIQPENLDLLLSDWESVIAALDPYASFEVPRAVDDPQTHAHYERAYHIMDRLSQTLDPLEEALFPYGHIPAMVIARDLSVKAANEAALAAYRVSETPKFLPVHPGDKEQMERAVAQVLARQDRNSLTLKVAAIRTGRIMLLHVKYVDARHVVVASNEVGWPEGFGDTLAAVFDLTQSEVAVLRGLLEHGTLGEIATSRKRSVGTIRNQIKSILAKTETRSQVELVRLVMSLMDVDGAALQVSAKDGDVSLAPLEDLVARHLVRPDGRQVTYYIAGDPNGTPVLYCSGDFGLVRCVPEAEAAMKAQGIKLIIPIRPAYGRTDPALASGTFLDVLVDDFATVMKAERAGKYPILSIGADSQYAVRIADAYPESVSAILMMAGSLPHLRPAQIERMDRWQRFLVGAVRYTPHLAPMLMRASYAMARRLKPERFMKMILSASAPDMALLNDPAVRPFILAGGGLVLAPNRDVEKAFLHQLFDSHTVDWSEPLNRVARRVEVHLWSGVQDPLLPVSTVEEFREDFPDVHYRWISDAGGLFYYSHWPEVIAFIKERLRS